MQRLYFFLALNLKQSNSKLCTNTGVPFLPEIHTQGSMKTKHYDKNQALYPRYDI